MKLSIEQLMLTLGDLSFEYSAQINEGIIGIYGISGSGKSTLLKLIAGIAGAQSGRLQVNDTVFFDGSKGIDIPAHRRRVGVVFQEHFLFPHMTVRKNLHYGMQFTKSEKIAPADVIKLLDLSELLDQKPSCLSGGERQRVAIGRALLQQPELLLLDEPFSSLDQGRRRQIISYLLGIHNRFQIPLVVVSHDLADILKLTKSMMIIENRSILGVGNYMQIVGSGVAPNLLAPKHFVNTVELLHLQHVPQKRVNHFGKTADDAPLITTNSEVFNDERQHGKRVRLSISPDDIALSTHACSNVSIQNQLPGKVTEILHMNDSFFVSIDCGVPLIAEITPSALYQLDIKPDMEIWCLFKAKAVEVVHVFENDRM